MTVVALGADHAGCPLDQDLKQWLVSEGRTVVDAGTDSQDLNVLAFAGRATSGDQAFAIVRAWLETPFQGGRHERRLAKVAGLARLAPGGEVTGARAR